MNKTDIKQIILEEIEATLEEMRMSPEMMAADSRPEDEDFSLEDEMEMARDFNDEQDDIFGKPSFVEENRNRVAEEVIQDFAVDIRGAIKKGDKNTENKLKQQLKRELEMMDYNWKQDPDALELLGDFIKEDLDEMARTSNVFKLSQNADLKQVLQFMQRVNDVLKTYKSPGQKRPKKRFTPEEMKALAKAMLKPEGFTSKDVIAATSYNSPAQANKFLKALEMKGLITLTSQLKKAMKPTRDPNAPETRGRKRKDAEFDMSDDPMADLDALGLGGSIDLSDPLAENNNTMSELEKYIKKVIKEAKNPLAKKMKEIENQGRVAALETKLAAIAEMIEETEGRLTRIDEDNEFRDMMDKNAVKEVRKQLKELERAKAKLEKERAKMEGKGMKKKEVVDEDLPVAEDAVENAVDEVELEEDNFKLNESTLRMQKLAGLITESDIKKKLSLNEQLKDVEDILVKAGFNFNDGILGGVGSGGAGYYDLVNDKIYGFNQRGPWNEEEFTRLYDNFEFASNYYTSKDLEDLERSQPQLGKGIYAVGNDGYVQIHDNGDVEIFAMPQLSDIDGTQFLPAFKMDANGTAIPQFSKDEMRRLMKDEKYYLI